MKLDTFKTKWGQKPAGAPPAAKPRPSLGAALNKPVLSSSAEHAPVEASAEAYDGIPLSLVLERHLERLKSKSRA